MTLAPEIPKGANVINVDPHQGQWTLIQALRDLNNREVYLRKGRRWGGTWTMALCVTEFCTQNPMSPGLPGKPTEVAFFGPVYENARKLWREIIDSFAPALASYRESDLTLIWKGGARGKCYSGENASAALGSGFDIVVIDEASNFPQQLVRAIIAPTLADRNGRLWVPSSPRHGKLNWFAQRCLKAESGILPGIAGFHFSSYDNPRISREWLEAQRTDPDMDERTFDEEYRALVLDSAASWLDPSLLQVVESDKIPTNTFNTLHSDFAWARPEPGMIEEQTRRRKDANVLAVVSQDALGNVYVRKRGVYEKYLEPDQAFEQAADLIRAYDIKKFVVEREVNVHRSTDDMFGRLWRAYADKYRVPTVAMIRPQRGAKWKTPAIRRWSVLLSRKKFFIEEGAVLHTPLADEMMSYSETAAANDRCHDDVLVALADVMLQGIWQGHHGDIEMVQNPGKDIFHLRDEYNRQRGEFENSAPRRSKYCII